ncbi:MAG: alginate export family protein [Candidatus Omnitrophota bacterium]|nr:alginate export family protein [Candidatus Omnitrophota bacterium]
MRHKVLLAVALAALMATPAFAAVQNVKVSGAIDSTYISRQHFNLGSKVLTQGGGENGLRNQNAFITQTTVRIDADLSDNVSTTVGLINERGWGAEHSTITSTSTGGITTTTTNNNANDTNVQLYLAYATMREFLYSPLTVSVGRQYFGYGNNLIIGTDGVNNVATGNLAAIANDMTLRSTYDGVKAILDYKPLTIDLLYFKNNTGTDAGLTGANNANKRQSDVYGLNANYQLGDAMNSVVEGYFFARVGGHYNTTVVTDKGDTLYVPGLRVSTNPIKGLNTQAEIAWQRGTKSLAPGSATVGGDNLPREAMAAQLTASYTLPVLEQYKPVVNASYTFVSGDKNGDDQRQTPASSNTGSRSVYTAWDPFNEAQGSGTIYNTLFNLTNLNIFALGVQATPIQDVTATATWSGLWLNKKVGTGNLIGNSMPTLQADGTATPTFATTGKKDLGNEYDVNVNYAYTEDVTFGLSLGWFVPGKTFNSANDSVASQALAHVNVNF